MTICGCIYNEDACMSDTTFYIKHFYILIKAAYCPGGHSVILPFKIIPIYIPIQMYGFLCTKKVSGSLQLTLIQFNDLITCQFARCQKL